ncbi:hypothetical protein PMAYCL1PPCAC_32118, partial [Pristionchus mayeri]
LKETIVPIVREDICEKRLNSSGMFSKSSKGDLWENYKVFCAGSMGHDVGKGDSGGPLMMKASDGRWFQIGITSFGDGDDIQGDMIPSVYTDVREYCEWISETTNGEVKCQ